MILFQRWRIVVSVLGLIALTAFLAPPREMPEVKPEVNPYNDYLSSAILLAEPKPNPMKCIVVMKNVILTKGEGVVRVNQYQKPFIVECNYFLSGIGILWILDGAL